MRDALGEGWVRRVLWCAEEREGSYLPRSLRKLRGVPVRVSPQPPWPHEEYV